MVSPRLLRVAIASFLGMTLLGCEGTIGSPLDSGDGAGEAEPADKEPGELVVSSPARASFISAAGGVSVVVEGHGATEELMINGSPVSPDQDGSFSTTVTAATGLNLVEVVDGDSGLDVPFLFGSFADLGEMVPSAVRLRVNAPGFNDADASKLSITSLAQHVLDDTDILASVQGQSFGGDLGPAEWSFTVQSATYGDARLSFGALDGGVSAGAAVQQLRVEGKLKVKLAFVSKTDTVVMSADAISVNADIAASYQDAALHASSSYVQAQVDNFDYDSNNAGFPCCVDEIITQILGPIIEDQVKDAVQREAAKGVTVALEQFGLPSEIDLSSDMMTAVVATQQELDGAQFDAQGATISVAAGVEATVSPGDPGEAAPGWLEMGGTPEPMATATPFGISLSLDTVNQAIYALWAQGSLDLAVDAIDDIEDLHVALGLPPVLLAGPDGSLRVAVGEAVASGTFNGNSMKVAISLVADVGLAIDATASTLTLSTSADPTVSVTWLDASKLPEALRPLIKEALKNKLADLLSSLELPIPTIPLDMVATSYGDSVAAFGPDTTLGVSNVSNQLSIYGSLLVASPTP